ncbi:sulfatase-like hydrolase/transferase [Aporhodopirellula rubra]|nr:sulfatase-like hydrolase/transferase [Aporhodopirellula rubra]
MVHYLPEVSRLFYCHSSSRVIHLFFAGVVLSSCSLSFADEAARRPNIVFLMTDDQRWDSFGCYGRPEFETHHIDRLAENGVIFDNAYYAVSICMPSRVTMMTGRYLSSHRVGFTAPYDKTLSQNDFANSYPALLKQAGYRTGFIGKFGFSVTKDGERPSYLKKNDYDIQKQVGDVFDFYADEFGTHTYGGAAFWPANDEGLQQIYSDGGRKMLARTYRNGKAMMRFLDTQSKDQPFCLSVSFYAVKPGHFDSSDVGKFKSRQFSVPENWVEGPNERLPKVVAENARGYQMHIDRTSTPVQYQRLVRAFAAQGYSVDQQVGLLMDKLERTGMLDNTIVIFTSDNGRFHGSHGLYDKALLYEESMKAPLIVFDGRTKAPERGRRERGLVSSVDMAPTILSLAGITPPANMQGFDFTTVLNQTQDMSTWQDAVFMENLFLVGMVNASRKGDGVAANQNLIKSNKSYRSHGVRTNRWKYFVYYEHDPVIEELYDMSRDPLERDNLVDNPEHAGVLNELRQKTKALYSEIVNHRIE